IAPVHIEPEATDPTTGMRLPVRTTRVQTFLGRPAIVAAVTVAPANQYLHVPHQPAPILVSVNFLSDTFLEAVSKRLELPHLRLLEASQAETSDNVFELFDEQNKLLARFAWTPKRPGAEIMRNVLPFLGLALGAFVVLTAFVVRYMRRTEATIA